MPGGAIHPKCGSVETSAGSRRHSTHRSTLEIFNNSKPLLRLKGLRVFIAGHGGMVGSAIVRRLASEGCEILTADRAQLDLTRQEPTERFIHDHTPQVVIVAAARVGG